MSTKEKDIEWVMNATGMNSKKARAALEKNNWQRERAIEERLKPSEDITDIFGSSDEEDEEEFSSLTNNIPKYGNSNEISEGEQKDDDGQASKDEDDNDDDDDGIVQRKKRRILDDDEEEDQAQGEVDKRKKIQDDDDDDDDDNVNKELDDDYSNDPMSSKGKSIQDSDDEGSDKSDREDGVAEKDESGERSVDDDEDRRNKDQDDGDNEGDGDAALPDISDDDSSDDDKRVGNQSSSMVYDFDIMMAKKKEENSRRRKRRNYDIINDNDDIIDDIIRQMKSAVDEDFQLNKNCMTATRKLKLLPFVTRQLRKVDLRDAFLDSGVLSVITDWLTPLPDRSLPHTNIRESLMKLLLEFNIYDTDKIKASGIGKAIMYLYKHPKETKENKQRARQLIGSWSRPIFQLDTSFSSMSKEEREQRDLDLRNKHRRSSGIVEEDSDSETEGRDRSQVTPPASKAKDSTPQAPVASRPGEKGWIPRARVPQPSMKDYVIRPKSNVDAEISRNSKKQMNMLDKYMRTQQERKRASRVQRAVNMKIDRA